MRSASILERMCIGMRIRSSSVSRAIKDELSNRRLLLAHRRRQREEEVYSAVPEALETDRAIREIAFDLGRQLMGAKDSTALAASANAAVNERLEEKKRLLVSNGFPADYLDEQFVCHECRDSGHTASGELCRCVTQLAVDTAFEGSGLNREQCFESFDLSLQHEKKDRAAAERILSAALDYAEHFPNNERSDLLYFGMPGVGKSFLLNSIGTRVLERGYSVLKLNSSKLIRRTMDAFRSDADERPDMSLPDLLIIDDLGAEPMIPNVTIETLLGIVSERQDLGKATLFATNLDVVSDDPSVDTLQSVYGERLASRLMAPRTVRIQAIKTANLRLQLR